MGSNIFSGLSGMLVSSPSANASIGSGSAAALGQQQATPAWQLSLGQYNQQNSGSYYSTSSISGLFKQAYNGPDRDDFVCALRVFDKLVEFGMPITGQVLEMLTIAFLKNPQIDLKTQCEEIKRLLFSESFNSKLAE